MKYLLILFTSFCFGQFNPVQFYEYGSKKNINIPLLDVYPSAKVALSLRKVNTSYGGNCVRVRRSSDDTEQDIGFSGLLMDKDALLSFVGASDGFITVWYDQSGNGLNATQTINANQPRIVLSGIIERIDGENSIRFDQTLSHYLKVGLFTFTTASVFSSSNLLTGNNNSRFFAMSPIGLTDTGATSDCFTFASGALRSNFRSLNITVAGSNISQICSQIVSVTQAEFYQNNTLLGGDYAITSSICIPMAINIARTGDAGLFGTSGDFLNGYVKELIFYDSDKSSDRLGIQQNLNQYYRVY